MYHPQIILKSVCIRIAINFRLSSVVVRFRSLILGCFCLLKPARHVSFLEFIFGNCGT